MCGFVGMVNGRKDGPAQLALVKRAAECLEHRGPDAWGTWCDGPFAACHHRLRVLDLSPEGDQPMSTRDGRYCLVHNGEIYNFRTLADEHGLTRHGSPLRTRTDTEVVLRLFQRLGPDAIPLLDGMFALAIWDRNRSRLYLARDPFGVKPLFYTQVAGAFWFASEIKALLKIPGFEPRLCLEAVHHYFSFDYIPGAWTAYEGILEVRPGHLLEVSVGERPSIRQTPYWRPTFGAETPHDLSGTVREVRNLLFSAVQRQLVSDVPVGVMLSGGMDSSSLAAIMGEHLRSSRFHTFSISFDDPSFDESPWARTMARHLGTHHHTIRVRPEHVKEHLVDCIAHIDEPYADGSALPTFLLAREAARHVTVLLSGEGGDEVFAGYDTHRAYLVRRAYRKLPRFARQAIGRATRLLPVSHRKLSFDFKARRFVMGAEAPVAVSHFLWRQVFSEEEKRELLELDFDPVARFGPSWRLFEEAYESFDTPDLLNRLLGVDCTYHLPDDLMVKNDRMTMAHGLEARVPFTDRALFLFVSHLSSQVKLRHGQGKWLLKQAMRDLLPQAVLTKKKVGLEMPYSSWFCGPLRDFLLDTLAPAALKQVPVLNHRVVRQVLDDHLSLRADRGRELWGILNFVLWYRSCFLKRSSSQP